MPVNRIDGYFTADAQNISNLLNDALAITNRAVLISIFHSAQTKTLARKIIHENCDDAISNLLITFTKRGIQDLLEHAERKKITFELQLAEAEILEKSSTLIIIMQTVQSLLQSLFQQFVDDSPLILSEKEKLHIRIGYLDGLLKMLQMAQDQSLMEY